MSEFVLRESRRLSGKGTIRTNAEIREKSRIIVLNTQLLRKPTNEYLNFKYLPAKSFYGTLTFSRNGLVQASHQIEFSLQTFVFYPGNDGEVMRQVACVNQEILQSIANLGVALGLTPTSIENETKDWQSLEYWWDTAQLICYADAAIKLDLFSVYYDICEELEDSPPPPPEPPLPDPAEPEKEPGQPLEIDDPYPEDDDNTYVPNPLDEGYEEPPTPIGTPCATQAYTLVWSYVGSTSTNTLPGTVYEQYGEEARVNYVAGTINRIEIYCQGVFPFQSCGALRWVDVVTADPNGAELRIVSFTI